MMYEVLQSLLLGVLSYGFVHPVISSTVHPLRTGPMLSSTKANGFTAGTTSNLPSLCDISIPKVDHSSSLWIGPGKAGQPMSELVFKCDKAYMLVDETRSTMVCQPWGLTGIVPKCVQPRTCPNVPVPHGNFVLRNKESYDYIQLLDKNYPGLYANLLNSLEYNVFAPGYVIEYKCDHNYRLVGSQFGRCLANGSWTESGRCEPITTTTTTTTQASTSPRPSCGAPPPLTHGFVTCSPGGPVCGRGALTADYICDENYALSGSVNGTYDRLLSARLVCTRAGWGPFTDPSCLPGVHFHEVETTPTPRGGVSRSVWVTVAVTSSVMTGLLLILVVITCRRRREGRGRRGRDRVMLLPPDDFQIPSTTSNSSQDEEQPRLPSYEEAISAPVPGSTRTNLRTSRGRDREAMSGVSDQPAPGAQTSGRDSAPGGDGTVVVAVTTESGTLANTDGRPSDHDAPQTSDGGEEGSDGKVHTTPPEVVQKEE